MMKIFALLTFVLMTIGTKSQNIIFPDNDFTNESTYEKGISTIASEILTQYAVADKGEFYSNVFRLHFATNDYKNAIAALDSFDIVMKMKPDYYKSYGFHYRIFSMAMLDTKNPTKEAFSKSYTRYFNEIYPGLHEDGRERANGIFEKANAQFEKDSFMTQLRSIQSQRKKTLTLEDALSLVKQWNYWKVYERSVPIALVEIKKYDEKIKAKKMDELMGYEEGALLDSNQAIFITGVTLVDVIQQKLLPDMTVGILGNKISSIQPSAKFKKTVAATLIDGKGKYLMPGMTDAHIHFFQTGGLYTRPDGMDLRKYKPLEEEIDWSKKNMIDVCKRYISQGITNVIDVGATYNFLTQRKRFQNKSYAPSIVMTGPLLTSYEPPVFENLGNDEPFNLVKSEDEGRKMVQAQLAYQPDFIKIWYIVDGADKEKSAAAFLPIAKAIIDEAHKNNLPVAVHATERITAEFAVKAGCDFLVHSIEDEILTDEFLKILKQKNITVCPTLTVFNGYKRTFSHTHNFSNYELKHANPEQLGSLFDLKHIPESGMIDTYKSMIERNIAAYQKQDSICGINLKKMADAGVRIAAGTDAGNIGTLHGTSYVNELLAMKRSGLSNWQVVQSATIHPVYITKKEKETGSITVGKMADMILLNANPLDDLSNLSLINLVINKGHVLHPDSLIKETPLALVQRQLNAYNARNLEAFLEPYDDNVEIYNFLATLLTKGKEAMRKDYSFFANVPELHCEITKRIIQENTIIDHESVTGFGSKPVKAIAIYQVENNKIKRVYFIGQD